MDTPKVRTGLGKSDCPGSQGGCRKRGLFKEVRAPAFYPDRTGFGTTGGTMVVGTLGGLIDRLL